MNRFTLIIFAVTSLLTMSVFAEERLVIPPISSAPFDLTTYTSMEVSSLCNEAEAARKANDSKRAMTFLHPRLRKRPLTTSGKFITLMGLSYVQQKIMSLWKSIGNLLPIAGFKPMMTRSVMQDYGWPMSNCTTARKRLLATRFEISSFGICSADNATAVEASNAMRVCFKPEENLFMRRANNKRTT